MYIMKMAVSVIPTPPPLFKFDPVGVDGMPPTTGKFLGVLCRIYQGSRMALGEHAGEEIATRPRHMNYEFHWCCHCTVIMIRAHRTKPMALHGKHW